MLRKSFRFKSSSRQMGRGGSIAFGLFWTAFSSIFVVVGLWIVWSGIKTGQWDEVPCEVTHFQIADHRNKDKPFVPEVSYTYQVEGHRYTGTVLKSENDAVDDYYKLVKYGQRIAEAGDQMTCRVNPENPEEAVLFAGGGDHWFGLIFAVFGGGFVLVGIGIMRSGKKKRQARSGGGDSEEMGGLMAIGFFGIFALAGLGMLFGLVIPKAVEYFAVKGWQETQAKVIWSKVRRHSGDDGPTYSADIFYKYQFEGREYRSNRYHLIGGSSSGRDGKRKIVKANPKGSTMVCYVNPKNPHEALVNRGVGWAGLFALFPLPFAAIGLGGLYATFIRKPKKEAAARSAAGGSDETNAFVQPMRGIQKKQKKTRSVMGRRLLAVVGALFIAAFWNGITSVFVTIAVKSWLQGDPEWFLTIFIIPFVVIGLFLIGNIFYRILAIFSPIYQIEISEEQMKPGDRASISWRRTGGSGRPRKFTYWLVGREEATYRRGTNTTTSTSVFAEQELFTTETPQMMPAGRCALDIPADAVPTFDHPNNKLQWFVILVADVPMRPDVREEFEIEVLPSTAEEPTR